MANRSSLLLTAAAGALALGVLAYGPGDLLAPLIASPAEATGAPAEPFRPEVGVVHPVSRNLASFDEFTGRFEAVNEVALHPRVSGQLEQIHFTSGEIVQAGDLLFTLDQRPFKAAVIEAEARLQEARASLRLAETELTRQRTLEERGIASRSTLDSAAETAEAARAMIAGAEAAVTQARLDLEFTEIRAPISGRISDEAVSVGNLIVAGTAGEALTTIVSVNPIHFTFDATEAQFLEYQRAAKGADMRSEAGLRAVAAQLIDEVEFTHKGRIDFIDNRIDSASGTIRGRAVFDNHDGLLTPGMFARLRMETAAEEAQLLVPDQAIGSAQAEKFVLIATPEGKVERRVVRPGEMVDGLRVVAGLAPQDQVIVDSLHMVGPGAEVRIRAATPDSQQVASR
ncbi:efflux RND transporter periplasmic adaptor subunit [Arenibacterium sp. LLYu02]|uniref:efflux RND transporter periplasmic adaptor subunit n=1 Tax=Arenibacterium sp. LLYu02 TaxID=3404132 RepID=UPI003B2248F1